ncbi:OX-2 membrane glycoprotein-like isoform X2 [Protopterus annectens]|uniref:OX-2 membrane glycoprotein-like isoform X2 n=1 Tax=Protopterus annectens TaxID=7888 RepID=UPI001CFAF66A|nr:OX-2 membrane glycoprotein-like isoform X2 [Protopterus annectens]
MGRTSSNYSRNCLTYTILFIALVLFLTSQSSAEKAMLGKNATLHCSTDKNGNVLQVTWQKKRGNNADNIGSYSPRFLVVIQEYFRDRFTISKSLTESSLYIQSTEIKDGGCYICIFNVFPSGAESHDICLDVYELPNPILQQTTNSNDFLVYTCTASAYPPANISWTGAEKDSSNRTDNPNGTVLVTSRAHFKKSVLTEKDNASCIVTHPELSFPIIRPVHDTESQSRSSWVIYLTIGIISIIVVSIIIAAVVCKQMGKKWCNRSRW